VAPPVEILRRERVFVHTHFATDCEYLPDDRARELRKHMERVLDELGIVFGIHFAASRTERGLRIVLECIPAAPEMERIEKELSEAVKDIPCRPRRTQVTIQ
jgi:hypothetical protein